MAQPILTASDVQLFSDRADARRTSDAALMDTDPSTVSTFGRWFIGTVALSMTAVTFALIVVRAAPPV